MSIRKTSLAAARQAERLLDPWVVLAPPGLLTMLYNRYSKCAGSGSARSLLQHLLTAAAAPYCAVLERWLRQGLLDDPYHEFMVQENQVGGRGPGHRH